MSEPLLQIRNRHTPECGDPPIINNDDEDLYIGYFENPFGEQWVFMHHKKTQVSELRGGDVEWNTSTPVIDGTPTGINLGKPEAAWLQACWQAATGSK